MSRSQAISHGEIVAGVQQMPTSWIVSEIDRYDRGSGMSQDTEMKDILESEFDRRDREVGRSEIQQDIETGSVWLDEHEDIEILIETGMTAFRGENRDIIVDQYIKEIQ